MAAKTKAKTGKRYTVVQKREMIKAWKQASKDGMTFKSFCSRRRVAESTLRGWMKNGVSGSKNVTRTTAKRRNATTARKNTPGTRSKSNNRKMNRNKSVNRRNATRKSNARKSSRSTQASNRRRNTRKPARRR